MTTENHKWQFSPNTLMTMAFIAPFIFVGAVAMGYVAGLKDQTPSDERIAIEANAAQVAAALKQNLRAMEVKRERSMAYFLKMQCPGPEHKRRSVYVETPEGGNFFCFGPKGTAPTNKPDRRRGAGR